MGDSGLGEQLYFFGSATGGGGGHIVTYLSTGQGLVVRWREATSRTHNVYDEHISPY
jgi:hypothetical protein